MVDDRGSPKCLCPRPNAGSCRFVYNKARPDAAWISSEADPLWVVQGILHPRIRVVVAPVHLFSAPVQEDPGAHAHRSSGHEPGGHLGRLDPEVFHPLVGRPVREQVVAIIDQARRDPVGTVRVGEAQPEARTEGAGPCLSSETTSVRRSRSPRRVTMLITPASPPCPYRIGLEKCEFENLRDREAGRGPRW